MASVRLHANIATGFLTSLKTSRLILVCFTNCDLPQGVNEVDVSRNRSGTSVRLAGDFALSLDGSRSQYLASNASARDVKLALEMLDTVGTVDVERYDGDEEVSGFDPTARMLNISSCRIVLGAPITRE